MKRIPVLMIIALVVALGAPPCIAASEAAKSVEIPWLKNFDQALQLAKQQGKPVLLDFFNPK